MSGQLRKKESRRVHDINVARGKTLPDFIMSFLLLSNADIGFRLLFSLIMLGMVTL